MGNQLGADPKIPDPTEISRSIANIAERSQRLVSDFLSRQAADGGMGMADPLNVGSAFMEMTAKMMTDPGKLVQAQMALWQDYIDLWQTTTRRMMGESVDPVAKPERGDRRFKDESWEDNEVFNFIKQSYLLTSRWIQRTVNEVDGLDDKTAAKVEFFTRQFVDALSPTNFVATNPEVLRTTVESGGENLVKGLENLLGDLERGKGQLRISMTDMDAFEVGRNVAATPGKVVYRNDLMELLQFDPTTETVVQRPLLIVPPWINKYYILDLREKNSFIKWASDQGHTVFVISWVNPDEKLARKTFADYMLEGPLDAIEQVKKATGEDSVNAVGYCIGGTLLASTLAYMAANDLDGVASATYFTTMVDFEDPGELGVFIDDEQLTSLEEKMNERGYLEGAEMATTFNMLRENDLIWSFVVNNYLLGKDPFPFDLLYWNSDSTRMPAAMHSFYLRKFYLENKLKDPGGINLAGTPIDLRTIKVPSYVVSTIEDHIAPWKSTYAAVNLYSGPVRFVLSGSGHIAGIVNPPVANKYGHWLNSRRIKDPDKWLEGAKQEEGSWWFDWDKWAKKQGGKKAIPARTPGEGALEVIGDAPGSYAKARAD